MLVPGLASRIWRTVSATTPAPPSGRSSRATMVTTACFRPIRLAASATRRGSSRSVSGGRPVCDGAEAAVPGADAAQDHERGRAQRPALPLVRAAGLFADGVQRLIAQEAAQSGIRVAGADPNLEPLRAPSAWSGVLRHGFTRAGQAAVEIRAAGIHDLRRSVMASGCPASAPTTDSSPRDEKSRGMGQSLAKGATRLGSCPSTRPRRRMTSSSRLGAVERRSAPRQRSPT